ncbi:MAG: tryptophan synthase subunit alpha [Bryobacter sp.]|nr:tryptophan synthase subunit alpha [Bryobacter sp.]
MTTRITQRFEQLQAAGEPALIAYLTAGDPTPTVTASLVAALERGGADLIELGVPFSDPIADGPVIMRAAERAIAEGTTLPRVLDIAREIRQTSEIPLVLFTYLNPVMRYGFRNLARDAKAAGIDGILLTDLSVEEAADYMQAVEGEGLDRIFLVAPTSTDRRLELVARYCSGFVYVVSRTGVTGERAEVATGLAELTSRVRRFTALPLGVGFGISKPEQATEVARVAEGVVVGSSFVKAMEETPLAELPAKLEAMARALKEGAKAARS